MNVDEQNLYLNFTKSAINNFEDLIDGFDKCSSLPSNADMILKMKSISQKMQRLMSKWDGYIERMPLKRQHSPLKNSNPISKNGVAEDDDDYLKELDYIQAARVGDKSFIKIEPNSLENVCETSSVENMEIGMADSTSKNLTFKEKETIRRLKNESVQEEWIVGRQGMYIKEYEPNVWRCEPCKKDNLSSANIVSHVNGKLHLRKIEDTTSAVKLLIDNSSSESSIFQSPRALEGNIIQRFNGFVCNVCDIRINSEESLKSHVNGSKHKKNCVQVNSSAAVQ